MRPMSTSVSGSARRNFMIGSKLWPPAMSLAPSPCSCNRAIASSILPARWYANWAGFISLPRLRRFATEQRFGSCSGGQRFCGRLHREHDVVVTRAAADIPLQSVPDRFLARIGVVREERDRGEHHARCAETTLQPVLVPERLLHGVQC